MLSKVHYLALFVLSVFSFSALAQDKVAFKFGKVSPEDFKQSLPSFDTGAHAIILGDVGYSRVVPNNDGGFGYEFERKIRVYIVDKNGIDAGKYLIPLYSSASNDMKEEIRRFNGVTYNLENGKVVETQLENNQVFTEKFSKNVSLKKFSLPALREGSIFELSYMLKSDYLFQFRDWAFQNEYPTLWSEYEVEIPEYFDYVYLTQGYHRYHINTTKDVSRTYRINVGRTEFIGGTRNDIVLTGLAKMKRWVMKDIPALKSESYITTLENYRSKIEFQLSSIRFPNQAPKLVMENWQKVSSDLLKSEDFGQAMERVDGSLEDLIKPHVAGINDPTEKAKRIYEYFRDNFSWNGTNGFTASGNLKNVIKTKTGTVGDINLMLIAALKSFGYTAYPIILSTRSRGYTHELYPLMDRFNYVVCAVLIGDSDYLLDASDPDLGFGYLPSKCYNGHARVLMQDPLPISLAADSLLERKVTLATLVASPQDLKGSIQSSLGYISSTSYRNLVREKGEDAVFNSIKTRFGSAYEISNTHIDSLKKKELPIKITYDFVAKNEEAEVLYIDPVLEPFSKENPFKSPNRFYPVEMPSRIDETYLLNFEIPEGYKVDEMPKSAKVGLNDGDGYFEYLVSTEPGRIQLRTRVVLAKAYFTPEEYESLREFFGYVINKQAEQIVLKKATP
ncbi:hypothetical protein GCM10027036_07280 [Flavihumibacter cheonanensis]|uniref:transglutaminase domain-containing protein n=1 Tax=Flavihumibacter cheonanensis TaxID=1442385 RepID=UPI001EF84981|nr:transglutaminase domain-containing protein [Flavihumibacter cheonanensis]MCG7751826.1 hypothetical protein [Flavihumibacter cheonanensis]